jgi:hypothetical protein
LITSDWALPAPASASSPAMLGKGVACAAARSKSGGLLGRDCSDAHQEAGQVIVPDSGRKPAQNPFDAAQ